MPSADSPPDRSGKRRPFATWVKKLTNFKASSSGDGARQSGHSKLRIHGKRRAGKKNNPYPQSGDATRPGRPYDSSGSTGSETSLERPSARLSFEGGVPPTAGARSVALTVSTDHEASRSINAPSHGASSITGTARTTGGAQESRQEGSTFSSPAPSVRSLTTTLTTIQSLANGNGASNPSAPHGSHHSSANNSHSITFNQPFPTTASPASALPPHLAPPQQAGPHPTTYSAATANNLLTDNASILTLASSSKRRRRRSFDTDASVRAMAPSSLWGGSRESLPLSVLSANVEGAPSLQRVSAAGERASLYSAAASVSGAQERGSAYARQSAAGDGASVRSGLLGHGRAESVSGSAGLASPLVSPLEVPGVDELEEGQAAAAEKVNAVEKEQV